MKILVTEEQAKLIFGKKYQCPKCEHTWDIEKKDKNYQLCHWCGWDDSEEKYNQNELLNFWKKESQKNYNELKKDEVTEKWSQKYKNSINCNNPKGFSQRAHCQGRKKRQNESYLTIENIIPTKKILNEIKLILESVTSGNPLKELIEGLLKKEAINITEEETTFLKQFIKDVETQVDELVNGTKKLEELTNEELLGIFKKIYDEKPSTMADGILKRYEATYLPKIKLIPSSETYKSYFKEILEKFTKENPNNPFLTSLDNFINAVETTYKNIKELEKLNTYLESALLKEDLSEAAKKLLQDIKDQVEKQIEDLNYREEINAKALENETTTVEKTVDDVVSSTDKETSKQSEDVIKPFDGKDSHMEKFNKIWTKSKSLADAIRTIVLSLGETKTMTLELTFEGSKVLGKDGNLLPEIINIIEAQSQGFLEKLKNGEYKFLENAKGNWDSLNKLDTNTVDRTELLKLYANTKGKDLNNLTEKQFNELVDDFIKDCNDNPQTIKTLIEENSGNLTKNIEKLSEEGLQIEKSMFKNIEDTGSFEIVWTPKGEGNPVDTIVGADMIVKRKSDNTYHLVQIKKSRWNLNIVNSTIKNGQIVLGNTSQSIRLKNGYVGLLDKKGNWIFFPPQEIGNYKVDKYGKKVFEPTGLGFNKNTHIIDIDPTRTSDTFYTNLDIKGKQINIE